MPKKAPEGAIGNLLIQREISLSNILMTELFRISMGTLREIQTDTKYLIQTIIAKPLIKG
jgi:hypothetical protein